MTGKTCFLNRLSKCFLQGPVICSNLRRLHAFRRLIRPTPWLLQTCNSWNVQSVAPSSVFAMLSHWTGAVYLLVESRNWRSMIWPLRSTVHWSAGQWRWDDSNSSSRCTLLPACHQRAPARQSSPCCYIRSPIHYQQTPVYYRSSKRSGCNR